MLRETSEKACRTRAMLKSQDLRKQTDLARVGMLDKGDWSSCPSIQRLSSKQKSRKAGAAGGRTTGENHIESGVAAGTKSRASRVHQAWKDGPWR